MPPKYVDECSKPQGTVDRTRNRVMIQIGGKVGKVLTGPPRASLAEAEEDLHALRALPRATISDFVERLKEGMSREDAVASLASTSIACGSNEPPRLKKRRLDISDQLPTSSQGRVEWTPVKPAEGGEASCTLSPHVALRLAQSCRKSPVEPLVAAECTPSKPSSWQLEEDAGCVLSPYVATRLAQSCRKALSEVHGASDSTPGQILIFDERESAEEKRLVHVAQSAVRKVFEHVRHKIIELGDLAYLPKAKQEPVAYNHLDWLRRKHAGNKLSAEDYELLARLPHILGQSAECIYGKVEQCDGGWRWTFVPVGLQAVGNVHASYVAAVEHLRQLQHALYPAWHDPAKRATHLQHLLRSQSLQQELHGIVSRRRLAFARDRLFEQVATTSLMSCSEDSGSNAVALACGLPNLGNTCYINAVTQCLFHCMPFREDIERQAQGASFMGDRLQALFNIYKNGKSTWLDVMPRVTEWVEQVLNQANFTGGSQQDAAEC